MTAAQTEAGLPADIAAALSVLRARAPEVAPRVARRLARLLRDHQETEPPAASALNRGGGPVEFACSSLNADIRYVVDIGGPVRTRLARIGDLLPVRDRARRGVGDDLTMLAGLQARGTLDWGAWLGLRHRAGCRPAFKVYAEVPPGGEPALPGLSWPDRDDAGLSPLLVGLSPEAGRREIYAQCAERGMPVSRLAAILDRLGLGRWLDDLVAMVRAFEFRRGGGRLPDIRFGCSYGVGRDGDAPIFSLFAFAADLAGGDDHIRTQLLDFAERQGLDLGFYAALTEPFASRPAACGGHNMIGFLVGPEIRPGLQISFRPPEPPAFEDTP
jgi:hypothetical protein